MRSFAAAADIEREKKILRRKAVDKAGFAADDNAAAAAVVVVNKAGMIFADDALLVFPSGTTATVVGSEYCKVYVDSWLAEDKGAVVKYLSDRVSADGLPPPNEIMLGSAPSLNSSRIAEPCTSDFEAVCEPGREAFDLEASGRVLKIRPATMSVASGDYGIYVRIGDRYTRIRVEVRW